MANIKKIKLSGETYDIYDASAVHTETQLSKEDSGSGNAVTAIAVSNHKITVTKGTTFATKAQLDAEATARASADTSEANARTSMDNTLSGRIDALEQRGRYLSGWNATTHLPTTYPSIAVGETYTYRSGDYYIVTVVGATNYRPKGTGITRTSEGYSVPYEAETAEILVGDTYTYDGTNFVLTHSADNNQTVQTASVTFGPNDKVKILAGSNLTVAGSASEASITVALNKSSIKASSAGAHTHTVGFTSTGTLANVPSVTRTTSKLVTTSIVPTNGTVNIVPAVANGQASLASAGTALYFNTNAIKSATCSQSFVTAALSSASLTGTTTFVKTAIKSAAVTTASASGTGLTAYVADVTLPVLTGSGTYLTGVKAAGGASLTGTTTFVTSAIKSAVIASASTSTTGYIPYVSSVTLPTLTGTKQFLTSASGTFNVGAISDFSLSTTTTSTDGPAVVTAVGATTLGGTTSFNTDAIKSASCAQSFTTEAYKAEYNSANECLELTAVTPTAVSISTSAASKASVTINSGTVTTKYMKHTNTAAGTASVTTASGSFTWSAGAASAAYIGVTTTNAGTGTVGISHSDPTFNSSTIGWSAGSVSKGFIGVTTTVCGDSEKGTVSLNTTNASATPVSISTANAATASITPYTFTAVDVATVGTAVSAAKVGSAVTVATGALNASGSGATVVEAVSIGSQSLTLSVTGTGTTDSKGAHEHSIANA